jgi:hypothetical protein
MGGALDENVVVRKFRTTTPYGAIENKEQVHDTMRKIGISDFSTKPTNFYNQLLGISE